MPATVSIDHQLSARSNMTAMGHDLPSPMRCGHGRCTQAAADLLHRASRRRRAVHSDNPSKPPCRNTIGELPAPRQHPRLPQRQALRRGGGTLAASAAALSGSAGSGSARRGSLILSAHEPISVMICGSILCSRNDSDENSAWPFAWVSSPGSDGRINASALLEKAGLKA